MWPANQTKIDAMVGDGLLLDIGGWCDPLLRADYVLDVFPYETRGIAYHGIGNLPVTCVYPEPLPGERFTKATWILHDICSERPFPFPDKMFDFVVCSHTLEDVRDPLRACSEIMRVGKAGYIETPSRLGESLMYYDKLVGAAHHRWIVEIQGNRISFRMKHHFLHTRPEFYVPPSYKRTMPKERAITYLFWENAFECEEISGYEFYEETRAFIASLHIPKYLYWLDYGRGMKHRARCYWRDVVLPKLLGHRRSQPAEELWTWGKLFEVSKTYAQQARSKTGTEQYS